MHSRAGSLKDRQGSYETLLTHATRKNREGKQGSCESIIENERHTRHRMQGEDLRDTYRNRGRKNIRENRKTRDSKRQAGDNTDHHSRGAPQAERGGLGSNRLGRVQQVLSHTSRRNDSPSCLRDEAASPLGGAGEACSPVWQ